MDTQEQKNTDFNPNRFTESLLEVAKQVIISPRYFYHYLPRSRRIANPFIFFSICAFLAALFMATFSNAGYPLFFILLFSNVASVFVGSFFFHLIVTKVFRSDHPFGATFRILAYAGITDIVSWVPVLGIAAYFYGLYLIFIGLQEVHHLSPKHAGGSILGVVLMIVLLVTFLLSMAPESLLESIKMMGEEK